MTPQQRLDDARERLHLLLTGQAVRVFVDQNGERVEYTSASRAALVAYVRSLEVQVSRNAGGPLRVYL